MDSYEFNKIAGAILATALLILGMQTLAGIIYTGHKPHELAYSLDVEDQHSTSETKDVAEEKAVPLPTLLASADAEAGAKIIKKCGQCHTWDKGGHKKIGPNLYGVMGRPVAHEADFPYSDGMKAKAAEIGTWNFESLNAFLTSPKDYVKGTKMVFPGLKKDSQRADLLMYLHSLSDSPIDIPKE